VSKPDRSREQLIATLAHEHLDQREFGARCALAQLERERTRLEGEINRIAELRRQVEESSPRTAETYQSLIATSTHPAIDVFDEGHQEPAIRLVSPRRDIASRRNRKR